MIATVGPIQIAGARVTTPSEREIALTRGFDAPARLVFRTLTEPELVKRWLYGPEGWSFAVCEIDLRVGGAYRYQWRGPDGSAMGLGGVYVEIARPSRIINTQRFDEPFDSGESRVTTVLAEQDGGTTLTMTVRYDSREARDGAIASNMAKGAAASFERLAALLASEVPRGEADEGA